MVPSGFEEIGYSLWVPVIFFVALACFLVMIFFAFLGSAIDELWHLGTFLCACGWVVLLGILLGNQIVTGGDQYWRDYRVEGTVTSVSNVLSEASGDLTRRPVITMEGIDDPLVVDNPRAIDLKGREGVVLKCTVGWHYRAKDTYECEIVEYGS